MSFIPLAARYCMALDERPRGFRGSTPGGPEDEEPEAYAQCARLGQALVPTRGAPPAESAGRAWKARAVVAPRNAMRAAAIDLGKVRVGLAVADELGVMAHPRPHLDGRNVRRLLEELSAVAAEEDIG